jgi:hypothetical protein
VGVFGTACGNACDKINVGCDKKIFKIFPTPELESTYITTDPALYSSIAALIYIVTSLVFLFYDTMVRRRQRKVMASAKRTNTIVSSLFPETVRERLYERAGGVDAVGGDADPAAVAMNPRPANSNSIFGSDPIADLFPHSHVSRHCGVYRLELGTRAFPSLYAAREHLPCV